MQNNPFAEEWRRCLREHYKYIIHTQDSVTEKSLVIVMQQVGFSESELAEMRVEATMRADTMPDDFVPDMQVLERVRAEAGEQAVAESAELLHPVPDIPESDVVIDDEADEQVEEEEAIEDTIVEDDEDDDETPNQLQMF